MADDSTAADIQQERDRHVRQRVAASAPEGDDRAEPGSERSEGGDRETTEPRLFTVVRRADESGVSGTGRVLDGCVFHNGQVVICWRGDINSEKSGYASLAIYPCWEAFQRVHVDSHPSNRTEIVFGRDGDLMARLIDRAAAQDADENAAGDAEKDRSSDAEDGSTENGSTENDGTEGDGAKDEAEENA